MTLKCPSCRLVNYPDSPNCKRCGNAFGETETISPNGTIHKYRFARRVAVCVVVCLAALGGFYGSLVFSADPLSYKERSAVDAAIQVLDEKGFSEDVFYLRNLAVFRSNDNWLNASVEKESAYAATNYPFEIVTVYPEFFTYPADSVEQAAILLHEARHLQGKDEKDSYEFVWKNRKKLGWTKERYQASPVWREVRRQTREYSPNLFVCDFNEFGDCTE